MNRNYNPLELSKIWSFQKSVSDAPQIIPYQQKNRLKSWLSFLMMTFCLFFASMSLAQVTTNSGSGLAATYPDLASAISALNAATITSPVTITLAGNETAPVGGYTITAQGTGVNTIIISGSSSTITAFTPQVSGSLNDAIFKLVGADFVTIQNFTMQENGSNTTTAVATNNMTEFGIALLYASLTNGSQNNTIQNNTISLNRTSLNTFGVYSNTRHAPNAILNGTTVTAEVTTSNGANSFNKVYTNSISNVNYGIVFIGAGTTIAAIDNGNDIGGNTALTGNTITNWGGGAPAASTFTSLTGSNYCVFMNQQINDNFSFNTITSGALAQGVTTGGFLKNYSVAAPTSGTIVTTINNNTITVTNNPTLATAGGIIVINNIGLTSLLATATMSINNNTIQSCVLGGGTTTTSGITGIANFSAAGTININNNSLISNSITATTATSGSITGISNSAAAGTVNINDNILRGFASTATSGQIAGIVNSGAVVTALNINNNQLGNASSGFFSTSTATSGGLFGILSSAGATTCNTIIQSNDIRGITYNTLATATNAYIGNTGIVANFTCNLNTFTNLNVNTTGTITMIAQTYDAASGAVKNVTNNTIVTGFTRAATATSGSLLLVSDQGSSVTGSTSNCTGNNFSNITVSGTSTITGFSFNDGGTTPTRTVTGNTLNNWTVGTGSVTAMSFARWNGISSLSNNTVSNITGQGAITGINLGSTVNSATSIIVASNNINNLSSTGVGGAVTGIICGNTSLAISIINNSINTLSSTAAANVLGINLTGSNATSGTNIAQNTIFNLSNTNAAGLLTLAGIQVGGSGVGNVVQRNLIYDLNVSSTNAAAEASGIRINGGTNIVRNNMIRFGSGIPNAIAVNGISEIVGTNSIFYNSIFINGSPLAGAGNSFAFNGSQTVNTRSFRNNIFFNARSNSGATGKNYAVKVGGTGVNPAGLTINNNIYFANGAGAVFGIYASVEIADLAAWKTTIGQDAASINADPLFVSASDLSLQSGSPAIDVAANIGVTNDFAGDSRPGLNLLYDIGADEKDGIPQPINDIQATSFISPISAGTVTQNIAFAPQALFTNNGIANQTGVTVRYRILNPSLVEVYNQIFVIPSLGSTAFTTVTSTTVTFPNVTLTAVGTHTIIAKAELVGDTVNLNDEISATITSLVGPLNTVASGNWSDGAIWNTGVAPICSDIATVSSTHIVTVNSASNVIKNLTVANGATLVIASGDLTVGCTNNNSTLSNNGTLTISGGTLNLNGNYAGLSGSVFNQSSGDFNIDGNANGNVATSVGSSTPLFNLLSHLGSVTGGNLTIIDPPAPATAALAIRISTSSPNDFKWGSGHTTSFGNGISIDASANTTGFAFDGYISSSRNFLGSVIINGGSGVNRWVSTSPSSGNGSYINGNLTINSGSELRGGSSGEFVIAGNIINNGILTTITTPLVFATYTSGTTQVKTTAPNAQTISGTGIFRNLVASPTHNFTSLEMNNNAGITFTNNNISASGGLIVNGSSVINFASGKNLTLGGIVTVAASSTLTLENNANLIQTGAGTNVGNIIVKRNTSMKRLDYTYWSSPVAAQNVMAFSPATLPNRFYTFSETTNAFAPIASTTTFAAARGYAVRAPDTHPTTNTAWTGTFTGVPNNGIISVTATITAPTAGSNGYNLIGNPYPSTVSGGAFIAANPGSLNFWTHSVYQGGLNNYATYTNAGGTAASLGGATPNGIIQVGQGFMYIPATAGSKSFTNAMRVADNNNQFFRTSNSTQAVNEFDKFWINATGTNNEFSQILVGYFPNGTNNFDGGLDGKQINTEGAVLSSLIAGEAMAIQGRGNFISSDVVPLGFKANTAGNYTLAIDHKEGMFNNGQNIFLKDNLTGTLTNLQNNGYNFVSDAGTFNNRFEIVYESALSNNNNTFNASNVVVFNNNNTLNINATMKMKAVKVFDIRGRAIFEKNAINSKATVIEGFMQQQQVLMVQITDNENRIVTKKVIF